MPLIQAVRYLSLFLMLLCAACAHPISITPDLQALTRDPGAVQIQKKVGYYIPAEARTKTVESAGGGGDKVSYTPYSDLDGALFRVLSNVFAGGVYVIKDPADTAYLQDKAISFVFRPTITTTSSSRNIMFWPPTDFSVTITCVALDPMGREIWTRSVSADSELTSVSATLNEHGLTGRKAAQAALGKLQAVITKAPEFRQ